MLKYVRKQKAASKAISGARADADCAAGKEGSITIMNLRRKGKPAVLAAILSVLVLCCACSGREKAASDDAWASGGDYAGWDAWASDGDYASWDAWASDGDYASWDAWASDGDYSWDTAAWFATDGNAQTDREVRVSTADELLDALESYTRVVLAPGVYDLDEVSDGRFQKAYWHPCYDGSWELVVTGLEHCAIVGETGRCEDVQIFCASRSASVLSFESCYNCQLTGVTVGHTEGGECVAGALRFDGCSGFYVGGCDLYGCGSLGIYSQNSSYITAENTLIRDCSSEGVSFFQSSGIHLSQCELRSCGYDALSAYQTDTVYVDNTLIHSFTGSDESGGLNCLFSFSQCSDIRFSGCEICGNEAEWLFCSYGMEPVYMDNCSIRDNRITGISLEGTLLVDGERYDGSDVTHSTDAGIRAAAAPAAKPASESFGAQETVEVSSVSEFLDAIGSDREIVLRGGTYDLTDYMMQGGNESWYWRQVYGENGEDWFAELVICGVSNLTVRADGGVEIVALPRYAAVLCFEECRGVTLSGFTAGHRDGPGECTGAVVNLFRCNDVNIGSCDLYGCGTYGVEADRTHGLTVRDTVIHDCSLDFANIHESCSEVRFENCDFNRNPGVDWVSFEGVEFENCRRDGTDYE